MLSDESWVKVSWNPVIGCDKYSKGCKNCYASEIALRLQKQGVKDYQDGFKVKVLPHRLNDPYSWKKSRRVFVNSMSDLFHIDVPIDYLNKVFEVMNNCPQHLFHIITKRAENMQKLAHNFNWTDNILLSVTIESDEYRHRLDILKTMPAKHKSIIIEPLIGKIEKLDLTGIEWVIVGGESGANSRPMDINWVKEIKNWCEESQVAFWFKQNSEFGGVKSPPLIDGKLYKSEPCIKLQKDLLDFL